MAKPEFIGIELVKAIANNLSEDIQMSGTTFRPDVFERLGINVISGIEFQDTKNVMHRKGGSTRRKVVGETLKNQVGYIEERKLVTTLTWNRYTDNIDNYTEIAIVKTDGTNQTYNYPLSELSIRAIATSYGEDLFACLFHGNVSLDKDNPLGLYDGLITNIRKDISSGRISVKNKNYVVLDAIDSKVLDSNDTKAFDTFEKFVNSWAPSLRNQPLVKVWATPQTKTAIVGAYANRYKNLQSVDMAKDSYRFIGMENVELVAESSLGKGDLLLATVPKNMEYGVDSLNANSFVKVKEGSDEDLSDIQFQIQSNQGTRAMNINSDRFCMSSGTLISEYLGGDYQSNSFDVTSNDLTFGNVSKSPDQADYAIGTTLTLTATPTASGKFVRWSDNVTDATRSAVTKGCPEALTAIFAAK